MGAYMVNKYLFFTILNNSLSFLITKKGCNYQCSECGDEPE